MPSEIEVLTEIRDLLQVIAEPALAERDKKLRQKLKQVVGGSKRKANAVVLMDGAKSRTVIATEAGIDAGNLSRLVKALSDAELVSGTTNPRLLVKIPTSFFDGEAADD